jgi:TRAP-type C4-dicarboxylate transport system substrate-binding protein
MNRRTVAAVLGLACFGLLGRTDVAAAPPITIRLVTPFPVGHILADTAFKFKEQVEFKTKGKIVVNVSTSVLTEQTIGASMTSCDPSQRIGEILVTGGQPIQDWAPQYFFFNGPYVITDYAHFQRVWFSHLGDELRTLLGQNGNQVALGTVYRGFRQFTSNAAINGPANFVGLKLRLPGVPDWIAVWSSLGVVPVTIPLGGIYNALRDGVADASEGDLTQILSLRLNEVQSHLSLTNHLVGFGMATVNACFMNGLSSSDRNTVIHEMQSATGWGTDQMTARESSLLGDLQGLGMIVVTPDAAGIRAAAEPAINNLFTTKWTVTTWQEVLSL